MRIGRFKGYGTTAPNRCGASRNEVKKNWKRETACRKRVPPKAEKVEQWNRRTGERGKPLTIRKIVKDSTKQVKCI